MKTLGTTTDGKYLVEMSPEEHWGFVKLESSINGRGFLFLNQRNPQIDGTNLAPVFIALDRLADAKISIFQVQEYINFLASVFGGYVKKEKDA